MERQKTFESEYGAEIEKAIQWLSNLEKCFQIKNVTLKHYEHPRKYWIKCCQVKVRFE